MEIPQFNDFGLLPAGDYLLTPSQLRKSRLVVRGSDAPANWDEAWRLKLVDNLTILTEQLWQVGITDIFVDGSFVEDKDHPNDIDGYFSCELNYFNTGQLQRDLNKLDPHKAWTWSPIVKLLQEQP
jgi:hypothetical protein